MCKSLARFNTQFKGTKVLKFDFPVLLCQPTAGGQVTGGLKWEAFFTLI